IEDLHPLDDPAAMELVEQVDVDVAELPPQVVARLRHAGTGRCASRARSALHPAMPGRSPISTRRRRASPRRPIAADSAKNFVVESSNAISTQRHRRAVRLRWLLPCARRRAWNTLP